MSDVVDIETWRGRSGGGSVGAGRTIAAGREPLRLADHFVEHRGRDSQGRLVLRRWRDSFWRYDFGRSCYRSVRDEAIDADLYRLLDLTSVESTDKDGNVVTEGIHPTARTVRDVAHALPSRDLLIEGDAPRWLDGGDGYHPRDLLALSNGILHLPTSELLPPTPAYFAVAASPVAWNPEASEPTAWTAFMHDLWPTDPESVRALQEWFGYCLTPDTRQHKAMMLVGPKRGGKGTIARVLTALIGADHVASPSLGDLARNFGLAGLLDKPLAIVADARLSGRTDQVAVVERLLSITGEDQQTVDRKHRDAIACRLPTRFMVLTNELPSFSDASGAIASRFIMLSLTESFYGKEDHDLEVRLLAELPGILRWAAEGYRRLRERGRFVQPTSGAESIRELEELGSPVGAFVAEVCELGSAHEVSRADLYRAWCRWCRSLGHDAGTDAAFGRDLRAAVPKLKVARRMDAGERVRKHVGIRIRPSKKKEAGHAPTY